MEPSLRSLRALDVVNVFMADVRDGVGVYLSVYLLTEQHWEPSQIGIVIAIPAVIAIALQSPIGGWIDKTRHKRWLLVGASLVVALSCLMVVHSSSFGVVAASQVALGFVTTIFAPCVAAITLGMVGHARLSTRIGRNESFNHTGNMLAAIATVLLGWYVSYEGIFYFSVVQCVAITLATLLIRERDIDHELARAASAEQRPRDSFLGSVKELFSQRSVGFFIASMGLWHVANGAMLPLLGQKLGIAEPSQSVLYLSLCIVIAQTVMIFVAPLASKAAARGKMKPLFVVSFLLVPIRAVLFAFFEDRTSLIALQVIDGVGAGIYGVLSILMMARLSRSTGHFNLLQGATYSAMGVGGAISSVLGGFVATELGYDAAFLTLGALGVLATIAFASSVQEPELQVSGSVSSALTARSLRIPCIRRSGLASLPPMTGLTRTPAFAELVAHQRELSTRTISELFEDDRERVSRLVRTHGPLRVDLSKHRATSRTLELLLRLAEQRGVPQAIEAMFRGDRINVTENRSVLHVALRNLSERPIEVDGQDVMPQVREVLSRMRDFSRRVRDGSLRGSSGERFTDVVNIGIGGSDLGPMMVCEALHPYWIEGPIRPHFVSNVDPAHLGRTLVGLRPETTLVIVASKTFTTQETLANAHAARAWLTGALGESAVGAHFVAVSTNESEVTRFGISNDRMFGFWDWVGGRFSLWSAIGLSIELAVGEQHWEELLEGAHEMDEHFRSAPLDANLPVLLAMIGVWYSNFWNAESIAVLPYSQALHRLPAWLQQGWMESNGKSVTKEGEPITDHHTAPVVWGEAGTNGQHAFYQLLHQGTRLIPVEFLIPLHSGWPLASTPSALGQLLRAQHEMLVANAFAQAEALMVGRPHADSPHRVFSGNRPSTTITFEHLDARTLGMLLALYEHRIFVEGVVYGINSFDQWGVELGKELAKKIESEWRSGARGAHDPSTTALMDLVRGTR